MSEVIKRPGMGWVRDLPSMLDFTISSDKVPLKLEALGQEDSPEANRACRRTVGR
jgi:hypothetical protein